LPNHAVLSHPLRGAYRAFEPGNNVLRENSGGNVASGGIPGGSVVSGGIPGNNVLNRGETF